MSQNIGRNKRRLTQSKEERANNAEIRVVRENQAHGKMKRAGIFATKKRT